MDSNKKGKFDFCEGDDFNLPSSTKLLNITKLRKVSDNNYEAFNVVAEDGNSIYYPPLGQELKGGQIYVSEDKIRDIVNKVLDKRLGVLQEDE